jgi:hypothetical protein
MCWDCHDTSASVFFAAMSVTFLLETITLWRIHKVEMRIKKNRDNRAAADDQFDLSILLEY